MQQGRTVAAVAQCYKQETRTSCTGIGQHAIQATELHKDKELRFV